MDDAGADDDEGDSGDDIEVSAKRRQNRQNVINVDTYRMYIYHFGKSSRRPMGTQQVTEERKKETKRNIGKHLQNLDHIKRANKSLKKNNHIQE